MNIFNKVAMQGLKKNRTRTIVTIIGVILSAAMITAVTTFGVSLMNYMAEVAASKYGDWQVAYLDADSSFKKEISSDKKVERPYPLKISDMPGLKAERIQISHIFLLRDSVRGLSMPCLSRWCQADCRKMTGRFFCPGKRQQKGALLTHWEIRYLSPWAAVWKENKN